MPIREMILDRLFRKPNVQAKVCVDVSDMQMQLAPVPMRYIKGQMARQFAHFLEDKLEEEGAVSRVPSREYGSPFSTRFESDLFVLTRRDIDAIAAEFAQMLRAETHKAFADGHADGLKTAEKKLTQGIKNLLAKED